MISTPILGPSWSSPGGREERPPKVHHTAYNNSLLTHCTMGTECHVCSRRICSRDGVETSVGGPFSDFDSLGLSNIPSFKFLSYPVAPTHGTRTPSPHSPPSISHRSAAPHLTRLGHPTCDCRELGLVRAARLENYVPVFKSDNFIPGVAQQFGQGLLGILA